MTEITNQQDDSATVLNEEERDELIPSYITLKSELNEAEQENIIAGQEWATARNRNVLDEKFLNILNQKIFGNVWRWAGKFRQSAKNIGVDAYRIPTELRQLLDDCRYWIDHNTYEPDEIAARFHHRLVWIHLYPNGNGRHARLAADLLLGLMKQPPFTWGRNSLIEHGETRQTYIAALQEADRHNYQPLMEFVRS